ncbi:hypothetical protein [Janibacter sp. G56]|uniref:hypothetical protein n=1 Tax=Janibacter sp. G56 TaxID=3418717 RepID=UPI003D05FCD3
MIGLRWPLRVALLVLAALTAAMLGARGLTVLPHLVLVVVVAVGLTSGTTAGATAGLAGGLVVDLLPPGGSPLGLTALALGAAGALAGRGRRIEGAPLVWILVVTAGALGIVVALDLLRAGLAAVPVAWADVAVRCMLTLLLAAPVVPFLIRVDHALAERRLA